MAIKIETMINPRFKTVDIYNFEYPRFQSDVEFPDVASGCILPDGPGFPFLLEKPLVSFKTYRALCEFGLTTVANRVIAKKKRSMITPDYVWAGVLRYGGKLCHRPDPGFQSYFDHAYDLLRKELKTEDKIPVYTMDKGIEKLPRNTSPGLPYIFTHPGMKKFEVFTKYRPAIDNYWKRVEEGKPVTPLPDCAAFARSHICNVGENKVRAVWAYPAIAIAQESRFAQPILDGLVKQDFGWNTAYGMEMMKGGMTWLNAMFHRCRKRDYGCKYLMGDYSSFDATVPAWLIRDIFKIIGEKIDFSTDIDGNKLDEKLERRKFRRLVDYFINTPIRNMDGRRFQKDHGVPSGSMFTNIIDTFVNFVVMSVIIPITTGRGPMMINCFGDDSVCVIPAKGILNIRKLAECSEFLFGMKLNTKKSYWTHHTKNVHYLGYYNFDGDPVKPTDELIASMLMPQYMKDDWAYCVARALGCCLAAAGNTPDVFHAARGVYMKARRENSENVDRGLEMIRSNPRMLRHLSTMGCADLNFDHNFFTRLDASFPRLDCTKLRLGILV